MKTTRAERIRAYLKALNPAFDPGVGHEAEPEFYAWVEMLLKCYDPSHPEYRNEGAIGIQVAEEFWSYEKFLATMGPMPGSADAPDSKNAGNGSRGCS
jgi:hypothetical protein